MIVRPFNAGSLHTAPADVQAMMGKMIAGFGDQARALARRLPVG